MLDFSKVKFAVASWFKKFTDQPVISGCDHQYIFKDQAWMRIGKRKYKLQNRRSCSKCNSTELKDISGE